MKSLAVQEDRSQLKESNDFQAIMKFLEQKYNRPEEIVQSILAKGASLPWPGNDRVSKQKMSRIQILSYKNVRHFILDSRHFLQMFVKKNYQFYDFKPVLEYIHTVFFLCIVKTKETIHTAEI